MNKLENRIGISIGVVIVVLLFLLSFGAEIESLNKGTVSTSLGSGIFSSMADFVTYNTFIIGCVLSVVYLCLIIGKRSSK